MGQPNESDSPQQDCPLPWSEQRRNLILFAICTGLQYLVAPVLYVGITQASLCDRLGASVRTSNLPATVYFALTAVPALIAWLSPQASALKRNLCLCYLAAAMMQAAVAVSLALPLSNDFKIGMVVLQAAVTGAVMPAAIALLGEAIGRGVSESHRGLALGMAFGAGPILAVIGSFAQTVMIGGNLFGLHFEGIQYPTNFVVLFGLGFPFLGLSAVISQFFVIPASSEEQPRQPMISVVGLLIGLPAMILSVTLIQLSSIATYESLAMFGYFTGLIAAFAFIFHFRTVLSNRVLCIATIVTILVYTGNVIPSNMNLYSHEVLGNSAAENAGKQNMLRFGFKVVAGIALGWMLTRTNPRTGVLATATIYLAGQIWALFVTGPYYLLSSGIHGAGELVGVYAPNYIVSASRRDNLRTNTAFMTMLMVPAAPAGYLFGSIVDLSKARNWTWGSIDSTAFGFRLSFLVCGILILSGIILTLLFLPANPRPEDGDSKSLTISTGGSDQTAH